MTGRKIVVGFWANNPETMVPTWYGPEESAPTEPGRYGGDTVPDGLVVGDHVYGDTDDEDDTNDAAEAPGLGGAAPVGPDAGPDPVGEGEYDPAVKQPDHATGDVDAPVGPDAGDGGGDLGITGPFDPTDHTVPEVVAYLNATDDEAERARVISAEADGNDRSGVAKWTPKAPTA